MAQQPDCVEAERLRAELVTGLKAAGYLRSDSVEAAFSRVPRHVFLPGLPLHDAYADRAHPTKVHDGIVLSSSSQPAIMAEMLEQLTVAPGDRIFEIGAGTGYNAALLAEIAGANGFVSSVDLDADIVALAREHLAAAGYSRVHVFCRDGALGDAVHAPFDAVIATVAVGDIPRCWVDQLRDGGRFVVPLALGPAQRVVTFERRRDVLTSTSIVGAEFMTFRGTSNAALTGVLTMLEDASVRLRTSGRISLDADALRRALRDPYEDLESPISLSPQDVWESLDLWLSVNEPAFCRLTAQGSAARAGIIPDASGARSGSSHEYSNTLGLCSGEGMIVFNLTPEGMRLRSFGKTFGYMERLQQAMARWNLAGRPANADLKITVIPRADRVDMHLSWDA